MRIFPPPFIFISFSFHKRIQYYSVYNISNNKRCWHNFCCMFLYHTTHFFYRMFLNVSALHRSLSRSFSVSFPDIVQYFIELLSLQMHFNHLSCSILMYWPFNVYDSECESWSLIWSDEKKKEWNLTSMRFSLESNFGSFWLVFFILFCPVICQIQRTEFDLMVNDQTHTHSFTHSLTHNHTHTFSC